MIPLKLKNGVVARTRRFIPEAFLYRSTDIHFLHLGKNAGSQVWSISQRVNAASATPRIVKRSHHTNLIDLQKDARYFFSVRDPVSRFYSAFYSRKRKGQPKNYSEWSEAEAFAFSNFEHANDLAESLFQQTTDGVRAWEAMKSISHSAKNQSDWFCFLGDFLESRPPIWIIRQEAFERDMSIFLTRIGCTDLANELENDSSPTRTHKNDYSKAPQLSSLAIENLENWYVQDMELYRICERWISKNK